MYAWKKLLLDMDMFYYSIQVGSTAAAKQNALMMYRVPVLKIKALLEKYQHV